MQLYAQERRRRFQSDLDVRDLRNDLDNVFRHNEEVEKQNAELTSKLASTSTSSSEVDVASIQKENESLRAQVDSLTHECEDLQKLRRDSNTNQEEWKKEREEYKMNATGLKNQIEELEIITKEDQRRIENLYKECSNLSGKLNESMELMEKNKTGYMNMKRRLEHAEKAYALAQAVNGLSSSSGSLNCTGVRV